MCFSFLWRVKRPQRTVEVYKVHISYVFCIAIADEEITQTIIIKICKKRSPAPIGLVNACHLTNIAETAISMIELEGIAYYLRLVPFLDVGQIYIVIFCGCKHVFLTKVVWRHHI